MKSDTNFRSEKEMKEIKSFDLKSGGQKGLKWREISKRDFAHGASEVNWDRFQPYVASYGLVSFGASDYRKNFPLEASED